MPKIKHAPKSKAGKKPRKKQRRSKARKPYTIKQARTCRHCGITKRKGDIGYSTLWIRKARKKYQSGRAVVETISIPLCKGCQSKLESFMLKKEVKQARKEKSKPNLWQRIIKAIKEL
jgi:hypothetical protein